MKNKLQNLAITLFCLLLAVQLFTLLQNLRKANGQAPAPQRNPYSILIQIQERRLYLLRDGKTYRSFPCATGKAETPSPLGSFKINRKALWGEGFGGYFLGLDCPWGNYGIHGTTRPDSVGQSISHGCFRLADADIRTLYALVPRGTPVCIVGGPYGAFGNGFRIIGPGMYGQDVLVIQKRLRELGFFQGACTGRYDSAGFQSALHKFEKANGLPVSDTITTPVYHALGFSLIE